MVHFVKVVLLQNPGCVASRLQLLERVQALRVTCGGGAVKLRALIGGQVLTAGLHLDGLQLLGHSPS